MTSISVTSMANMDAKQVLSDLWDEFGSELVLLGLFCAGFSLFRITTIRQLIPGSQAVRSRFISKVDLGGKLYSADDAVADKLAVETDGTVQPRRHSSSLLRTRSAGSDSLPSTRGPSAPLSAALELAVRSGDLDRLRACCEQTVAEGAALPSQGCEAALRACAMKGDSNGPEVLDMLATAGFDLTEATATAVVSLCAESRHVRLAEHLVAHCRRASGHGSLALYSALMKVYSHARLWHKTCALFERMKHEGVELDTVAYGSLIKAAVESGRHDLARELFKESGNPDLLNYMSMIRAAGRERDVPRALRLLEELERSPLPVDATAYNCALEACVACNDRAAAEKLFQRMAAAGTVDVVSYNTYLKVLLGAGAREEVAQAFRDMRARGLAPNVVTYNSLIRDAVSRQDGRRAWQLVEAMENAGIPPDAFTCSILMKSVKHNPVVQDLDRITDLMQRAKVVPDEVLVNCLLDTCVRLRDTGRLTKVLQQFRAVGVVPSAHAYATLIRAYGHARCLDRAWDLWRESTGGDATACDEEAFVAMAEACASNGDASGAVGLFRDVGARLQRFPRAAAAFASVVKACMVAKKQRMAVELYGQVKDHFVCGRVTFNTLIDSLVRATDMNKANELFRDMALKNVAPDLITYSTMIKGYCARGDLEQALQLLGLMQRRGIAPDAVLFNSILDGCAHKQMRTLTEQVLRDMEAAGIAPSPVTLSILVKLYGRCGDLDAALDAVEHYPRKYGFSANAQVFTSLMSACITNGELDRAVEVFERMSIVGAPPDAKAFQTLLSGAARLGAARGADLAARLLGDALRTGVAVRLDSEVLDTALLLVARSGPPGEAADLASELRSAGAAISQRAVRAALGAAELGGRSEDSCQSWSRGPPPPPVPRSRAPVR